MAYLGNAPARSFISFERQVFTIVNSQTVYTLSHSVTNENDIRLVVNNVVQEPGSGKAYTASGTTLTLSAALTNGTDEMYCVFLGRAVGTVNAPAGSVDTVQLADDAVTADKLASGVGGVAGITSSADATAMTITSDEKIGIGETTPLGLVHVKTGDSGASADSNADELIVEGSGNSGINILSGTSSSGNVTFGDSDDANVGRLEYNHGDNSIRLDAAGSQILMITSASEIGTGSSSGTLTLEGGATYPGGEIKLAGGVAGSNPGTIIFSTDDGTDTDPAERMRIDADGSVGIGNTPQGSLANPGFTVFSDNSVLIARNGTPMFVGRTANDGTLIDFRESNTTEGTISVSGGTVSYNGFTGTHWSRFTNNLKPTILRGTVLESLDEMCDWYQLHFTDSNGTVQKIPHVLTDTQSVGDVITYLYDTGLKTPPTEDEEGNIIPGGEAITENVQATIVKEYDVKHMMSKVSDTTDAKNVYGVFVAYDLDGEGYNDFYVASVGSFVVRIKANETIAKGDLLQSNGDGTAKVQTDDNVKSSSFAKVLSTTVIETYDDGSFIVPCSLMC